MPTTTRREDQIIRWFLSAYEAGSWADSKIEWPDKIQDKGIDALATRKSDGMKLAIEHTIVQPFSGDLADIALFTPAFLEILNDASLVVPGRRLQIFVPVGTLNTISRKMREAVVTSIHNWIKSNRLTLCEGESKHNCEITGIQKELLLDVTLTVKVLTLSGGIEEPGILQVGRQQVRNDLGEIVENILGSKLPKLIATEASRRILMLERQHMNLFPQQILNEIETRRKEFPDLEQIDKICIVETIVYENESQTPTINFCLYERGREVDSYYFHRGKWSN